MPQLQYQRVQAAIRQVDLAGLAPTMLAFMKANVASNALVFVDQHGVMSKPGCIIASPSFSGVTDQDYVHHWTRDAAITVVEIAESLPGDSGVDQALCDYVSFSQICQTNAINSGHFFRAAFQIDGNVRDWSDQKDGPALQSLAFVAAWPFLDDPSKAAAKKIAQRSLDETVENWQNDVQMFGPWEDVEGPSFYPSDTYDGDVGKDKEHPTKDHPWALCTANFAQLYYLVARAFESGRTAAYDDLTGSFFDQIGLDAATVNNPADASTVADALRTAGDEMLRAVIFHSDHYRLSEQFDGTTGFEKSVSDLTWSYAAYLRAVRTR